MSLKKNYKVVELVGARSVINGAYLVYFFFVDKEPNKIPSVSTKSKLI